MKAQKAAAEVKPVGPDLTNYKKPAGPAVDRRSRLHKALDSVLDENTVVYGKRPVVHKTLSILNPKDLEKMTGVPGGIGKGTPYTGFAKDGYSDKCTQCGGTGRKMIAGQNRICPSCDGSGKEEYSYFVHGSAGDVASV